MEVAGPPAEGSRLVGLGEIENTVRYLGIEVDDAIEIVEKIDI